MLIQNARIMQEEIFGPVVALTKAKDFDEAIEIANNTEYGLTGAVISNNRENIEKARRRLPCWKLILQPWLYWSNCWLSTVWWIQYVRNRL